MTKAIEVENLSKAYQLGEIGTGTLSRDVERWLARIRGKEDPFLKIGETNDRSSKGTSDIVWSLKDINFTIEQGEAVGIIGRNGAGKSTLLKLLSRVTAPTTGSIRVKGRIASLLEVGTGFHPELTGRENVFLNGAILGMRKKEILSKFDAIVDFSGVERYIDTPVKRYSSGMYVRLAFAVAAFLESEILVIDEVLAVGDAEFQKKCLGKMGEVTKSEGRTVLFVSHNLSSVRELCNKGILLQFGQLQYQGSSTEAVDRYLQGHNTSADMAFSTSGFYSRINHLTLRNPAGEKTTTYLMGESILFTISLSILQPMRNAEVGIKISSSQGLALHYLVSTWENLRVNLETGEYEFAASLDQIVLLPGKYQVGLWTLVEGLAADVSLQEVTYIEVLNNDASGNGVQFHRYAYSGCETYARSTWQYQQIKE